MTKRSFKKLFDEAERHLDYWVAGAEVQFTDELFDAMERQQVNRAELARRIGTSQAYITKVLRGNANFTLATMVKLARALDLELKLHLAPRGAFTSWKDDLGHGWEQTASLSKAQSGAKEDCRIERQTPGWPASEMAKTFDVGTTPQMQHGESREARDDQPAAAA